MKKKLIIVLLIVFLIGIILASMYITDRVRMKNNEPVIFSTWGYSYTPPLSANDTVTDMVIIKNNEISNEELIDEFIEKSGYLNVDNQEIDIIQDDTKIKLKYTSGEYAKTIERYKDKYEKESIPIPTTVPSSDGSYEQNKKIYGYYSLIINDELKGEYPLLSHIIKRNTDDNNVALFVDAPLIEYTEIPTICIYSLESSNYSKKYDLVYKQRKDLGIKEIFDAGDYKIKTFGGDVSIIIEGGDVVYSLEDALNQKVITPDDLLSQAKMDSKYGICQEGLYSDGGSIEYCYYTPNKQYTILKLNALDSEKDLIIGMGGQILNSYNKNK